MYFQVFLIFPVPLHFGQVLGNPTLVSQEFVPSPKHLSHFFNYSLTYVDY